MSKNIIGKYTFRLLAENPSFFSGFSSLLDFGDITNKFNTSNTDEEADTNAIDSDWHAVGQDMWEGINKSKNERGKQLICTN